jgi:tRNA1(Val) A37 N6-methylase TrmN6
MTKQQFNEHIKNADFKILFNELGWDNAGSNFDTSFSIDETDFDFIAIARKSGFIVYTCNVQSIPSNSFLKKLDNQLRRYGNDYILIFNAGKVRHLWLTPVKTVEKRNLVTIEYSSTNQAEFLHGKLPNISFELDEEVTIVDVTFRIHSAFEINSGKITKKFYTEFKKQHNSFQKFISGINVEGDKQWYASIMLNRLMFCYFIQKKGFLDGKVHYLREKLVWTKEQKGNNQFFGTFYKGFLSVLFHGGLNNPEHSQDFEKIYGRIPYLNGGLFDEHPIEKQYANLDIEDNAFEDLFDFFDEWQWHLDTRITASGNDINPDVLGYIFEQYINDRAQMGAYYTKEDITEYIGKNCIIPFLMDEVAKTPSKKHFSANGFVWQTLKNSGQKYIYDAVKKGYGKQLPENIERGVDTTLPNLLERRSDWNKPTSEEFALPTEIWRETVERLQRCEEITKNISEGNITQINDFITYNLDIRTFVEDLLRTTDDHLLVKHFYKALQNITILDPTCGSGAFLFAALNILEPLYEVCIDRIQEFNQQNSKLFVEELLEIEQKYRSNIQYFIYKSIILRNLYGVDIMAEATEIARLRLFLKMVAVVDVNRKADNLGLDPLPDIDFNIRCGNALIGFATDEELQKGLTYTMEGIEAKPIIEDKCDIVATAFTRYKEIQLIQGDNFAEFRIAKQELSNRLSELNHELNQLLHKQVSGIKYDTWLQSHQPFHWFAEFYEIVKGKGGFDVIIGNPPYVEYTVTKFGYKLNENNFKTYPSRNLYSLIFERSKSLLHNKSRIGMIVQISSVSTPSMETMATEIKRNARNNWLSNYATRPAFLFEGVTMNLTIILSEIDFEEKKQPSKIYASQYLRWKAEYREHLFQNIPLVEADNSKFIFKFAIPKLQQPFENLMLNKLLTQKRSIQSYLEPSKIKTKQELFYRTAGGRYFKIFGDRDFGSESKSNKSKCFQKKHNVYAFIAILGSNIWWWYYTLHFDMYNCKDYMMFNFPFDIDSCKHILQLEKLGKELSDDLYNNAEEKQQSYATTGSRMQLLFRPSLSKPIIDEIDKVLAEHYGFSEEELDFIINYDIKYRMGKELEEDE